MIARRRRSDKRRLYSALTVLVLALAGLVQRLSQPRVPVQTAESARFVIEKAVDGDTARLEDRTLVRYIGVDTPEMRHREGSRWVKDPEPFAKAAMEANRKLVEGREVTLESDVEPRDRYGRRLAYVYVDGEMVNERLLRDGLAKLMTIPPNVKYVDRFKAAQTEAREARRGLWAQPETFGRD